MVELGLFIRLEVRPGHESAVEEQLRKALSHVDEEPDTIVWMALRLGPTTYAIVDAFPHEAGRQAHLEAGRAGLAALTDHFTEPPQLVRTDVLAAKIPAAGQAA
ncbi:MAG TPA: antibiotic biosynthesis monooxygenase [Streptosporangiaceae bacterium]|jgi:quinol monooxygenase YgiN